MTSFDETFTEFRVVLNDELQYSIWPRELELPAGWRDEGTLGSRADCLAHIDRVWSDMRPRSLREAMSGEGGDEDAGRPG